MVKSLPVVRVGRKWTLPRQQSKSWHLPLQVQGNGVSSWQA
nr:MAG TPA: hypothetical protein [Caudoviricetes sp.]